MHNMIVLHCQRLRDHLAMMLVTDIRYLSAPFHSSQFHDSTLSGQMTQIIFAVILRILLG